METITQEKSLNFAENDTIYIHGEFDDSIMRHVIPKFDKMIEDQESKKDAYITVNIDSRGGYTNVLKSMLARFDDAKSKGITIETFVTGEAASCASLLAVSGSKGHRYINRDSEHLAHLGDAVFSSRTPLQLKRKADSVERHFNFVLNTYKKNCKIPNLENELKDDCFIIHGDNLIKWGLADKFIK